MIFNETNTFCISLQNSTRWERISQRFKHFDMNVTRWNASTPDTITDNFHSGLSVLQKACSQSHINIWKHVIENKLDYALVFEDDAMLHNEWKTKISTLSDFLSSDNQWDLICLSASESAFPLNCWTKAYEQFSCVSYVISNRGASKLINRWNNYYCASDWMTSRLQLDGHSYTQFPWIVIQEGLDTTIGSNLEGDTAKVIRLLGEVGHTTSEYKCFDNNFTK
jgi:GR25 family glycosyltransferase involved in LPS biosynthesis